MELQQILQQIQREMAEQMLPQAQQAVKEALEAQAPITDIALNYRGGKWIQVRSEGA